MSPSERRLAPLLAVAAVALAASCASTSTKWVETKVEPGAGDVPRMKKILVIGLGARPESRKVFEDEMVAALKDAKVEGVGSLAVLGPEKVTEETLRAKISEGGFDGLILTRLASAEMKEDVVARSDNYVGQAWWPYNGYSDWYSKVAEPGYLVGDLVVRLETKAWSAKDNGKLVWSGLSETVHPKSLASAVRKLASMVVSALRSHRLI